MSQPTLIQTKLAVSNLHGPDKNQGRRHKTIEMFFDAVKGGIGGVNELNPKDRAFFKAAAARHGMNVQIVGLNAIAWNPRVYKVSKPRIKKIMQGGHVGADGVHTAKPGDDDRRVGPNRYGIYFDVTVIVFGFTFEFDITHTMARAFTKHKWRIPLFRKSIERLGDGVQRGDGIMVGDFNTNPPVNLPGVADVNVPAPPDMGRQHYTKILRWGQHIFVSSVKGVNTPSDHDMLIGLITIYKDARDSLGPAVNPRPKPASVSSLPKPGNGRINWKRYGAPVRHPWARIKRRNKRLRSRIIKWRAAYRRRRG